MLKIVANVSKKVRIPGLDFSSQSFMAGIEVEVSDGSTPEQLQHRIREVYHLLEHSVDNEIRGYGGVPELSGTAAPEASTPEHRRERSSGDDPRQEVGDSGKRVSPSATTRNGSQSGTQPVRREEHSDGAPASQNRSGRSATQAQQKAIHAIAKSKGLDRKMLTDRLREVHGVTRVEELTVGDASELIDTLKNAS